MDLSEKHWFIFADNKVLGPFSKSDINQNISQYQNPLIWGRGQSEWASFDRWNRWLLEFEETERRTRQQAERIWKVAVGGQELQPMNHDQMMDYLKSRTDYGDIVIWTEGYSEWKEIYQIHKLMDELGVSRRNHPRVPIMGTLNCEGASGTFTARVLSISEGGLGITDVNHLKIGEKFKTVLKSPNLFSPIHATAEVVYVGDNNYAGLKFVGLHSESKGAIIEYVKKFQDSPPTMV